MQRTDFLAKFENLLQMNPGSLAGGEELASLPNWDSLAQMGFIALVHREFGARFTSRQLFSCRTVDDLIGLLGEKVTV